MTQRPDFGNIFYRIIWSKILYTHSTWNVHYYWHQC